MSNDFVVKDSGERVEFNGGMVRDAAKDKIDFSLALDGPMFKRWAVLLTNAAKTKYAKRNWLKANDEEAMNRFKESAFRHFIQWYYGDLDEDHAASCIFNLNGYEYVKEKLEKARPLEYNKKELENKEDSDSENPLEEFASPYPPNNNYISNLKGVSGGYQIPTVNN